MGFYEIIHECGDNNYCVSVGSTLDDFNSVEWKYCKKHKLPENRIQKYNISNFCKRYSRCSKYITCPFKIIKEQTNFRGLCFAKIQLFNIDLCDLNLQESKKIFFRI